MTKQQIIQSFKDSFGSDIDYINHVREVGKTTVRCEFVDWIDYLGRDHQITEYQRQNTTASDKDLFKFNIEL
jgi:hypothetical protein